MLLAFPVHAHDPGPLPDVAPLPAPAAASGSLPRDIDQMVYKGVVGNLLDQVPMDAQERLDLQRANAVVGNALGARSVAILLGVTASPLFVIGGLIWGLVAASKIKPGDTQQTARQRPVQPAEEKPVQVAQQPVEAVQPQPVQVALGAAREGECGEDWMQATGITALAPAAEAAEPVQGAVEAEAITATDDVAAVSD